MKKIRYICILLVAVLVMACTLVACQRSAWVDDGETLWIGNTAATTGGFAVVGVPFNIALEAYIAYYNEELRGENDREVKFKHYDDGFDAATGLSYTEKLVEEDNIFALVGHFGTNTVGATLNYIKEQRVPMVYAATGVADLFYENAKGAERYILPVQPIFTTEGSILLMRAVSPTLGLGFKKIGVVFTNDDAGIAMKGEIEKKANQIKAVSGYSDLTVSYQQVSSANAASDAPAAVAALKTAGVQCVIVAANQAPSTAIINAMASGALEVPILTSYVNASVSFVQGVTASLTSTRKVYTNAWVDSISKVDDVAQFTQIMTEYAVLTGTGFDLAGGATDIRANSYAMAGYIAAATFIEGLQRTIEQTDGKITQAAFVDAMEASPVTIPMSGTLDFSNGQRRGVERLSFYAYNPDGTYDLSTYKEFKTAAELMASITAQ